MKIKKKYFIIIIFILAYYITGCTSKDSNTQKPNNPISIQTLNDKNNKNFKKTIKDTSNRDIMPGTENMKGIRSRIYNDKGEIDNKYNYSLKTDEVWEKFIAISNSTDNSSKYKLILLVDYKQCNFNVDGNPVKDYTFQMNKNETIEMPVSLNKLNEGLHDILFLVVIDDNKSTDIRFRNTTLTCNLICFRFNIIVNNNIKIPNYNLTTFKQQDLKDKFNGIILNKNESDANYWFLENATSQKTIQFYNHFGNSDFEQAQKYAVITFSDWKQLGLGTFIEVNKGKQVTVPSSVKLTKGIHNLNSILILNPYEKLSNYNNQVFISARVGLNVK